MTEEQNINLINNATNHNNEHVKERKRILQLMHRGIFAGLLVLLFFIMKPFIVPLLWSVILTILLFPLFRRINSYFPNNDQLAALLTTSMVVSILLAGCPLLYLLFGEVLSILRQLERSTDNQMIVSNWIASIKETPYIGSLIAPYLLEQLSSGFPVILDTIKAYNVQLVTIGTKIITNAFSFLFNGAISILSLYFLLSHSKFLVNQIQTGALRLGGPTYRDMLVSIYETLRATLRGILLTSVTQGFLAGIAYFVAGAPFPILLTLLTALSSLLPFGTPFIYVPVALLLISGGASWFTTVAYLVWCIAVVSTADNILRPIFISSVTKISFLLVLFGIIGGLITFGLLGIFVGPVTIVLASQLWRDFVSEDTHISQ